MAIVKIESGKVVQVWKDIQTPEELRVKYGLFGDEYREAENVTHGMTFNGSAFLNPVIAPAEPEPERREIRILKAIIAELRPEAQTRVNAEFEK